MIGWNQNQNDVLSLFSLAAAGVHATWFINN